MIAHRGASAYEVENSLAAFRAAIAMGADAVELDIHDTADGEIVVHHDPALGGRAIGELTASAVRSHRLSNGEAVPLLSEVLEALGPAPLVFVEVKSLRRANDRRLFETLAAGPAPAHYHVHSFDHRIVRRLKAGRPDLVTGVLSTSYPVRPFDQLVTAGAVELWQAQALVDQDLVRGAHERDMAVYAWTVDDPARMRWLLDLRVDGICSNRPDVAREVVQ
ncbi:MAG TPA: glycerophosphodiester phosphodiesterase [Gemmatimonadales bacterium]|nr:glycerophosphodiester phosphodiesterase [Gemmatimonadales bacterium]